MNIGGLLSVKSIQVEVDGEDEERAIQAIEQIFESAD
jgi:phosphotransferase system HPr-like phosphotransfer protein